MRARATVAYDGSAFHGFADNAGVRTVAGELNDALTRILHSDEPIAVQCAGRTDKGVHALGQVVSFDVAADTDLDVLVSRLNRFVGPQIAVFDPAPVPPTFDARFSALSRTYRYVVWNRPEPDPFHVGRAWHVGEPLDLALLQLSCDPFIGSHDFAAFCRAATRRDGTAVTTRRRVLDAAWTRPTPDEFHFSITATSFCHQMVRSVVGTMVEVGLGRRSAGDLTRVIASADRSQAGRLAPAEGLYLTEVAYP